MPSSQCAHQEIRLGSIQMNKQSRNSKGKSSGCQPSLNAANLARTHWGPKLRQEQVLRSREVPQDDLRTMKVSTVRGKEVTNVPLLKYMSRSHRQSASLANPFRRVGLHEPRLARAPAQKGANTSAVGRAEPPGGEELLGILSHPVEPAGMDRP